MYAGLLYMFNNDIVNYNCDIYQEGCLGVSQCVCLCVWQQLKVKASNDATKARDEATKARNDAT